MSMCGTYRGVPWSQRVHRDVFPSSRLKSYWYFILGVDGKPTGDHFFTQREMFAFIDHGIGDTPTLFPGVDAGSMATDGHSLARRNDPATSKQAAAEIAPHLGELQARVVEALRGHGGRTATELTSLEGIGDPRRYNRRLTELVRAKIVVVGATRPCRVTGKSARTYWLVEDIERSGT